MSDAIERLFAAVLEARSQDPAASRTARLLGEGITKIAKKVIEEAAEVSLDAVQSERQRVIEESADLLYNLAVLWVATGVAPSDVWDEMAWRERAYGIAGKLPKESGKREG